MYFSSFVVVLHKPLPGAAKFVILLLMLLLMLLLCSCLNLLLLMTSAGSREVVSSFRGWFVLRFDGVLTGS